jgi:hypothetical protein
MAKILLLGYDYADDIAALATGAADLCDALCKKKFAIGLENLPFNTDLDEQLDDFKKRINQINAIAQQTFHLSWEQLLHETSPNSSILAVKALQPLIPRAKTLHLQQAILNTLQHHPTTPFFGLSNEPTASSVLDCLSSNGIKYAALFNSKNNLLKMKNDFKSFKVPVEASFLFSAHYPPSEETEEALKEAYIPSTNISKFCIPSTITSFIQEVCKSLDEKGRLSISMKALGKSRAPKQHQRNMPPLDDSDTSSSFIEEKPKTTFSKDTSLATQMKSTLKQFRGLFNDGDTSSTPTPTIVGNKHSQDDDS